MSEEVWKDVVVEGKVTGYKVSNLGNVKSPAGDLLKHCKNWQNKTRPVWVVFAPGMYKGRRLVQVSRLVAECFVEKPKMPFSQQNSLRGKSTWVVKAKDGDLLNVAATNIYWSTGKCRPVEVYDTLTGIRWCAASVKDAAELIGASWNGLRVELCKHKDKTKPLMYKGFVFTYIDFM